MPSVVQPAHALGRPGNDMRYAGRHLLLAARTPEGPARAGAADPTDEPFAVAVGLTVFDPAHGSGQVKLGVLTASAMGSGHVAIIAGQLLGERQARFHRSRTGDYHEGHYRTDGYRAGATRSAKATTLSS